MDQEVLHSIDQDIKEILESPEFDPREVQKTWKWKWQEEDSADESITVHQYSDLIVKIAEIIAALLPWILLLSLFIVLIAIIIMKRQYLTGFIKSFYSKNKPGKTGYLHGKSIEQSVLPVEIIQKAKQLWKEAEPTPALSLLYRGAIFYFMNEMHIPVPASATENECYEQVTRSLSGQNNYAMLCTDFSHLIRIWLYSAYAGRHPDDKTFYSLCHRWDIYFKDKE